MKYLDKFAPGWPATYDVPNDWVPIIDRALDKCFAEVPGMQLLQIKEKFGELRIYTSHNSNRNITRYIREVERKIAREN